MIQFLSSDHPGFSFRVSVQTYGSNVSGCGIARVSGWIYLIKCGDHARRRVPSSRFGDGSSSSGRRIGASEKVALFKATNTFIDMLNSARSMEGVRQRTHTQRRNSQERIDLHGKVK